MAWETEIVRIVRNLIGDIIEPFTYESDRLQELILTAAQHCVTECNFSTSYTVDVDELVLSPDPTVSATRDNDFISLVSLKSACMLRRSELWTAAGQAITIQDGTSSISLKGAYSGKKEVTEDFCKQYKDAKDAFNLMGGLNNIPAVRAIFGVAVNEDAYFFNGGQ